MLKHCNSCDTTKPIEEFYKAKGRKDGRSWWCSTCAKAYRKKKYNTDTNWEYQIKCLYGLDPADYYKMYDEQGGACKICSKNFPRLCVDHCHNSGKVRGLLCQKCNKAIGLLGDNLDYLTNAITYLESSRD